MPKVTPSAPTLDEIITAYTEYGKDSWKPTTVKTAGETTRYLRAFFGPASPPPGGIYAVGYEPVF